MKRFYLIVIIGLLACFAGCGAYQQWKINKLEKANSMLMEDIAESMFTEPELIDSTSAIVSKKDGILVPRIEYRDTGSFKTVRVPVTVYDTIREVDTIAVLVNYHSLKMYQDSIYIDDVEIKVLDTLQKNRIFARQYLVKNKRTEDFYNRREIYLGGTIGGSDRFMIGPTIYYEDKNDNLFGGSYLMTPDGSNTILVNYAKKIKLKKNR